MDLAFNLLLILLIEIPVAGFFFRSRKRNSIYLFAFLINIISWPIINVIRLNTEWNLLYASIAIAFAEFIAYYFLIKCSIKKAFLIALTANTLSYFATKYITLPENLFKKPEEIIIQKPTSYLHESTTCPYSIIG
jgi:presenilin-like A22 family membrane protease